MKGRPDVMEAARQISQEWGLHSVANAELQERLRMIVKLFSLYPLSGHASPKASMVAYLEETSKIHALILSHALKRLTSDPERKWLPTPAQIQAEAAKVVRENQPRAKNAHALGYNPWVENPKSMDAEQWLAERNQLSALPACSKGAAMLVERAAKHMRKV